MGLDTQWKEKDQMCEFYQEKKETDQGLIIQISQLK